MLKNSALENEENLRKNMYRGILYKYESYLLHELQHAYDHYRSDGKALKKSDKYVNKMDKYNNVLKTNNFLQNEHIKIIEDFQKEYLNLKHEVDARFSQAIQKTDMMKTDYSYWDKYENIKVDIKPFKEVFKDFKNNMDEYSKLSDEHKRRIHKKLAQFYELEKDYIKEMNRRNNVI